MSDEQALPLTTRETIDAWLEAGWATSDTPDWLSGGYVTKERAQTALRMLADQIDELRSRYHAQLCLNVGFVNDLADIRCRVLAGMSLEEAATSGMALDGVIRCGMPDNTHPEVSPLDELIDQVTPENVHPEAPPTPARGKTA